MKITKLKRIEMKSINHSNGIYYSAVLDGVELIQHTTDGVFNNHLTMDEWVEYIKEYKQ